MTNEEYSQVQEQIWNGIPANIRSDVEGMDPMQREERLSLLADQFRREVEQGEQMEWNLYLELLAIDIIRRRNLRAQRMAQGNFVR